MDVLPLCHESQTVVKGQGHFANRQIILPYIVTDTPNLGTYEASLDSIVLPPSKTSNCGLTAYSVTWASDQP